MKLYSMVKHYLNGYFENGKWFDYTPKSFEAQDTFDHELKRIQIPHHHECTCKSSPEKWSIDIISLISCGILLFAIGLTIGATMF